MITKFILRLKYACNGILFALKNDNSYRLQFYGIGLVVLLFLYFFQPISEIEFLFILLAYTLILVTELQNSSFEAALDRLHPERHEDIGRSKDMAAGAVLTAGFFLVCVLLVVALH